MGEFRGALLKPSEKSERRPTTSRSIAKSSRYEVLKEKIRGWWDDRLKIGEALREIQADKLYQREYATFEEFCEEEFGLKRAQAYRLIETSKIKESLSPMGDKIVNERQVRALAAVPTEHRETVIAEVAAKGPVTAKAITVAAKTRSEPRTAQRLDKTDYPIPEGVLEDWDRAETKAREWLSKISQVRSELKSDFDDQDVILANITNTTLADLNNAYTSLKCIQPYAVCASCQGVQRKKCGLCKGRGFLDHFAWKSYVPEETRKMREEKK